MADPVIRPRNGLLCVALQSAEGTPATINPTIHVIPVEDGSVTYSSPFRTEDSSELNGSFVGSAPLITDYSAAKAAILSDLYGSTLTAATLAALPDNWSYAGTSPADSTARLTDQPCATIWWY